ncbi:MAG: FAD-dependent oxidoreductase, partial [Gammaproteobacteria bacterium]|nr:FAD-dependent oxidoreductase [Gammaproteobacteria bacterium]
PVGFYYKAFFKPRGAWKFWEPIVRRKAGLGKVNFNTPHGYYDKAYGFFDVAVIGGGPAGMSAALQAAQTGAEVLLVEEHPVLGGSLSYARFDAEGERAAQLRSELVGAIEASPSIKVMTSAVCNGWFSDNWLPVIQANRMYKIRATELIIASGSIDQPAVFRNNDLPGVMQGSAAQRLIRLYGIRPGRRAVVMTANSDGYGLALDLIEAGTEVACVVDLRNDPPECVMGRAVQAREIRIVTGHTVYAAIGNRHVQQAEIRPIIGRGKCGSGSETISCDLVAMSVGYTPTYQLPLHSGAKLEYDDEAAMFSIAGLRDHIHLAGSVNATTDLDSVLDSGRRAGWFAARALGKEVGLQPPQSATDIQISLNHPWPIFPHPSGKEFVDFDEDLQVADIVNACADGYDHVELVKRFSTVGMGPSQGRHSALTVARLTAEATGRNVTETGVTTGRPPFTAEKLAHVAGRSFEPERHTPMHHRHLEARAQMMPAGLWWRPAYYGPKGERDHYMNLESRHVRDNVGLIDVSTLGGLEVRGPDAGELLNRIYTFAFKKQPVGRARYVVMTNEQGVVVDDGVACRFDEQHYYVTATTGGVDNVYRNMLLWNAQWRLDVDVAHATSAWSGANIAGPNSRKVLQQVCDDVDLSAEAFPYMGVRKGIVAGIPSRIIRVGFVGELGYEIHVPSSYGEALWDRLLSAGAEYEMKPFGVETQRLLRLEKGHIIIGQDTDSMSHPHEVHLAWAISRKKPFFVGGRSIDVIMEHPLERKLVGFTLDDSSAPKPKESHLVIRDGDITGRVTSCYYSPTIGKTIGLTYVAVDQAEPGTKISIRASGGVMVTASVVELPFYDPENQRQEM